MSERDRKAVLRGIPYGLYVIGATNGATTMAFTANWLSQCSFTPPLVMLGVKKDSRAHGVIEAGKVFSINFLDSGQKALAAFFTRAREADGKGFGDYAFERGATGAPLLADALACAECRVTELHEGGDHSIIVGEVVGAKVRREGRVLTMDAAGWKYGG